jgi:hypothetical protein
MSDQDEQKYGLEGIEQAQGYEPMQMAVPDPDPEPAFDTDSALAKHLERPAPPEPVERTYSDVQTGEATPDNQTVELKRAATDIASAREQERLEVQKEANSDLHAALDYLQQEEETLRAATTPVTPNVGDVDHTGRVQTEPQPEPPGYEATASLSQPQPDPEAVQAMDPQYDAELAQALSSPKVRAVLENVNQQIEQTKAAYQQQLANAALTGVAAFAAAFPD